MTETETTIFEESENEIMPKIEEGWVEKVIFHENVVRETLLFVEDILQRSSIPFMILGDIGKLLFEQEVPTLDVSSVEIGILKGQMTDQCISTLNSLCKLVKNGENYFIDYNEVPVKLTIISHYYPFFMNPDVRYYMLTEFRIPNPFNAYWEERDKIE